MPTFIRYVQHSHSGCIYLFFISSSSFGIICLSHLIILLCEGDTYIRLFNGNGIDVARNDDGGCGQYKGSRLWYNVVDKGFKPCRYYYLVQGCYDEVTCGGIAYITVLGSGHPTSIPSGQPSGEPSALPTTPTSKPSDQPSGQPSAQPSGAPSIVSTGQPTRLPSGYPSCRPSGQPSMPTEPQPTSMPSKELVVDETATILIATLLPLGTCIVAIAFYCIYRHYKMKYYRRLNAHKIRCVGSVNCTNEDILTQIDFFEEFY